MQPGQTFTPSGGQPESDQTHTENERMLQIDHVNSASQQPESNSAPLTPQPESAPPAPPSEPAPMQSPESSSFPPDTNDFNQPASQETNQLTWTASEFIEHQKPQGWYLTVVVVAVVIAAILYLLLRDAITVVVVLLAAVMFAVVGARKPRALTYSVSRKGIQIGDKGFTYDKFKSFSVIEEGAIDSIQLIPAQRLMPPISLYFPPEQEEEIANTLGNYLPFEERNHDAIDKLMKRFRF